MYKVKADRMRHNTVRRTIEGGEFIEAIDAYNAAWDLAGKNIPKMADPKFVTVVTVSGTSDQDFLIQIDSKSFTALAVTEPFKKFDANEEGTVVRGYLAFLRPLREIKIFKK